MEFVLATQNPGKVIELRKVLPESLSLIPLPDSMDKKELPESQDTLEGNALEKATFVFERIGQPAIADDTGLEIEALDGKPGVYSARYAGDAKNSGENMRKVLNELNGISNRKARFRTVIGVVTADGSFTVEGIAEGRIAEGPRGDGGFGYDPIFIPDGYDQTFAEMSLEQKAEISHRTKAIRALVERIS